jgi:hypothetical protein
MPIRGLTDGSRKFVYREDGQPYSRDQVHALNREGKWLTSQGRLYEIATMDTDLLRRVAHLLINAARRHCEETAHWYLTCPPPQGEMAQDAFDAEFAYWCEGGDEYEDAIDAILWDAEQHSPGRTPVRWSAANSCGWSSSAGTPLFIAPLSGGRPDDDRDDETTSSGPGASV